MRISCLAKNLGVLQLTVNDTYLEKVSMHEVLGITLSWLGEICFEWKGPSIVGF